MKNQDIRPERCGLIGKIEVKRSGANPDGSFTGYGSVFNEPHETSSYMLPPGWQDRVNPGAFSRSLSEHKARGTLPAMVWQHNLDQPIGVYTDVHEDANGLYVDGQLAIKVPKAAEIYELMKIGAVRGLSIGFKVTKFALDEKARLRTILELMCHEISPVTVGADPLALIGDVKSFQSIRDLESYLRDAGGLSRREAKRLASERWKTMAQRDAEEGLEDLSDAFEDVVEDFKESAQRDAEVELEGFSMAVTEIVGDLKKEEEEKLEQLSTEFEGVARGLAD